MNLNKLGISGRIAAYFQAAQITPLLAIVAFALGMFALVVTPREEEPQINVTMANVMIPFPGASTKDVEKMVSIPAEQVLSQIAGVEHITSSSMHGLSVLSIQFKVGVPRTEALVRLHDTVSANQDWLPKGLGVLEPIIKPKGIDDVPILTLTLYDKNNKMTNLQLEKIANQIESDLKRVKGTREVKTVGGPHRGIRVEVNPDALAARGFTIQDLRTALQSANLGLPVGDLLNGDTAMQVESGPFIHSAEDVREIVLGVRNGAPVFIKDIAQVVDGAQQTERMVWYGKKADGAGASPLYPAVTLSVTKNAGENAIDVANELIKSVNLLKGVVVPDNVEIAVTRNYGDTANAKAQKLIQKLLFATASVVALVFFLLGRREAAIVGAAVILTLTVTLFASWAWGFTLNRVSLFALIFSIGILVDDAIVIVENIHRHQHMFPTKRLRNIIPAAVDEVGGATILATLTVIAALLPMAFVTGLMGPYMSPIPINASMGMILSLAIAFVITPWLSLKLMKHKAPHGHVDETLEKMDAAIEHAESRTHRWLKPKFQMIFSPFLRDDHGSRNRKLLALAVMGLIALSVALPVVGAVVLKMLPFDNKSEFQVVLDMPSDTRVEKTAAVLQEMGQYLSKVPELQDYQIYAGTAAPINFNGLVRQYYLRSSEAQGDIQVNLVDKHERKAKSHAIAMRVRPALDAIAKKYNGRVKVVEVPPGPPVLSPLVAEIYGPTDEGRYEIAQQVLKVFRNTEGVVDVDDSSILPAPKKFLVVDRRKANLMGVPQQVIVTTLRAGLSGEETAFLHDETKYPAAAIIRLPESKQGSLDQLLKLTVRDSQRELVPLRELVTVVDSTREQPIFHKDLLPVNYVVGDVAGSNDSPLYGMFKMRPDIHRIMDAQGNGLHEFFISQPRDPYRGYSIKWDGESQVTYETFRDMGIAYAVGMVIIYLLVVAQFGSYLTPLIIMAPIPLTIIGVMPGHALLGSQFTATSMIGMIALAGIIVRNSILLVDFINLQVKQGVPFKDAVVNSSVTRAQPIALTGMAAMLGAFFILDDPIFNGLAISLIFGILVSTLLTLVVIPLLYYVAYAGKPQAADMKEGDQA
jgi:multidrug efflux pump subunit AcrB